MRKMFTLIALVLVLAMMPFALFSCNEKLNKPNISQDDEIEDDEKGSESKKPNKGDKNDKNDKNDIDDTDDSQAENTDDGQEENTDDTQGENTDDSNKEENTDDDKNDDKNDDKTDGNDANKVNYLKLARNSDKVKLLGRTQVLSTGLACDHTASGIEFKGNFEGDVKLKVRTAIVKPSCEKTYFTVYVDGERLSERFEVATGIKTLTVASFATKSTTSDSPSAFSLVALLARVTVLVDVTVPPATIKASVVKVVACNVPAVFVISSATTVPAVKVPAFETEPASILFAVTVF